MTTPRLSTEHKTNPDAISDLLASIDTQALALLEEVHNYDPETREYCATFAAAMYLLEVRDSLDQALTASRRAETYLQEAA